MQDLYFTGGRSSFAAQFDYRFPTHAGVDGKLHKQIPVAMVALVATAISDALLYCVQYIDMSH